jgi:hypothetical protein
MRRVAFELSRQRHAQDPPLSVTNDLGVTVHDSNLNPATAATQGADTGLPHGNARKEGLFRDQTDQLILGITTTGKRCACASRCGDLKEIAPIHSHFTSEMARRAIRGGLPLFVTIHAETHGVRNSALGHRHGRHVTMTGFALD